MASKDKTIRSIFDEVPQRLSKILTPAPIKELLPTNFPASELIVDFLAILVNDTILHMEFQSFNDPKMAERMLQYLVAIRKRYGNTKIIQIVVYVGNEKLNMKPYLKLENLTYSFQIIDIRDIDCRLLLNSDDPLDRIVACLCKVEDEDYLIKKVLEVMEEMKEEERKDYLLKLLTLTELRPNLRIRISEEVVHMPIVVRPEDIDLPKSKLEKDLLYRIGLKEGLEEGLLISAQDTLLTVIKSKLGYVPEGLEERIRKIKDRQFIHTFIEKLVVSDEPLQVLKESLNV